MNTSDWSAPFEVLEARRLLASVLPPGFEQREWSRGFDTPTAQVFAPDGRLFVLEKAGRVRVVASDGRLLPTPFVTVNVDATQDRGLVGLALDPGFATNGHLYLYYTTSGVGGGIVNRLSRFTASAANADVAAGESERPILDVPMTTTIHTGGAMGFGGDGMLYLATGDGGVASAAQNLGDLRGKVLRLDPGNLANPAPPDNPFVSTPGARAEVWALGFRNPFTGAIAPAGPDRDPVFYVNDVGDSSFEEVNGVERGLNYGWPHAEGNSSDPAYANPLHVYAAGAQSAVTGGAFYTGNQFPNDFDGSYFLADYLDGAIGRIAPSGAVSMFATGVQGPLDLDVGPDGALYVLSALGDGFSGEDRPVYRIGYVGEANRSPAAVAAASVTSGLAPLSVGFSAIGSTDPDGDALAFVWDFGDGSPPREGRDLNHTYQFNGTFLATVTAFDGRGGQSSAVVMVTVGNRAPLPRITTPAAGTLYSAGDVITFAAAATDPDEGPLPASALTWSAQLVHAQHTHAFFDEAPLPESGVASFQIPTGGGETDPDQGYRIFVTATDAGGLRSTTSVDLRPRLIGLTLAANVPGLTLFLDDRPVSAPHATAAVAGMTRTLSAPATQTVGGRAYRFESWSHGGAAAHAITTPSADTTYTANYAEVAPSRAFGDTPITLPDVIEAEHFDHGGQGVAYHDTTPANEGGAFRDTGVDLQVTADVGGGYAIGFAKPGEWVEYTVDVLEGGTFDLDLRVAARGAGGTVRVEIDGIDKTSAIAIPDTGGWQVWQTLTVPGVAIDAGRHVVRVAFAGAGPTGYVANLNYLGFRATGGAPEPGAPAAPTNLTARSISATQVQIEWTDNASDEGQFQIERSTDGATWYRLAASGANVTSYTNRDLTPGKRYYYRVYAVGDAGSSAFTNVADAVAGSTSVDPDPTPGTGDGLHATYYDDMGFTELKLTRVDPVVDFDWGGGSPAGSIGPDTFSVRWTGQVTAPTSEVYTFFTRSDDGARLVVNGQVLIDRLIPQGPTEHAGQIAMVAGERYDVRLDYFERAGGATAKLSWASPTTPKQLIPRSQLFSTTPIEPPPPPPDPSAPATPTGLTAQAISPTQVRITWVDRSTNETLFKIERSTDGSNYYPLAASGADVAEYVNGSLTAGKRYYYRVYAINGAGASTFTNVASAVPGSAGTGISVWERGPSLPVPLGEVAAGVIDGKLYVVGHGGNATYVYDTAAGAWGPPVAQRPFIGDHHAAEVIGGRLYLFGGLGGGSDGKVQVFDPATGAWSTRAPMPFAAGSASTALIGGKVYVAGGIIGTNTTAQAAVYDPANDVWAPLPSMPQGRNHAAAGTDGQRFYVIGGRDGGNTVSNGFNTVQIYDLATGNWASSGVAGSGVAPLPQARGGMGKAAYLNGEFYVMGGETSSGAGATSAGVYDRVDVYNPATNAWRLAPAMPTARHGVFPVVWGGRIYVPGGGVRARHSASELLEVLNTR